MVIVLERKKHVFFLFKCLVKSKISKYIFKERIIVNLAKIRSGMSLNIFFVLRLYVYIAKAEKQRLE